MNVMNKISIIYVLLFSTSMAYSQVDCNIYLQRAEKFYAEKNCVEAIKQYKNYKECNPTDAARVDARIAEVEKLCNIKPCLSPPQDKVLKIYNCYNLEIKGSNVDNARPNVYNDFKIITTSNGNLTLSFKTEAVLTTVLLIKDDNSQVPVRNKKIGDIEWRNVYYADWKISKLALHLLATKTDRKFEGSATYLLDAGTYTLRITRSLTGISPVELEVGFERR